RASRFQLSMGAEMAQVTVPPVWLSDELLLMLSAAAVPATSVSDVIARPESVAEQAVRHKPITKPEAARRAFVRNMNAPSPSPTVSCLTGRWGEGAEDNQAYRLTGDRRTADQ